MAKPDRKRPTTTGSRIPGLSPQRLAGHEDDDEHFNKENSKERKTIMFYEKTTTVLNFLVLEIAKLERERPVTTGSQMPGPSPQRLAGNIRGTLTAALFKEL